MSRAWVLVVTSSFIPAAVAHGTGPRQTPITTQAFRPGDVRELLDHGSKVIILSRGRLLALRTCPETLQMLRDQGITYHIKETSAAVELYNRLAQTEAVGGLFHSTC
jgi:hypothetical protein